MQIDMNLIKIIIGVIFVISILYKPLWDFIQIRKWINLKVLDIYFSQNVYKKPMFKFEFVVVSCICGFIISISKNLFGFTIWLAFLYLIHLPFLFINYYYVSRYIYNRFLFIFKLSSDFNMEQIIKIEIAKEIKILRDFCNSLADRIDDYNLKNKNMGFNILRYINFKLLSVNSNFFFEFLLKLNIYINSIENKFNTFIKLELFLIFIQFNFIYISFIWSIWRISINLLKIQIF